MTEEPGTPQPGIPQPGTPPERAADGGALLRAVAACLAGAGLALFAATRVWAVTETARGGGLSPLRAERTGADLLGWLPAVALVALAGAGALLALRGTPRRVAGALVVAAGLTVAAGGVRGLALADAAWWPLLTALGGVVAAAGGALAAARGHRWAAMGARYERRPAQARLDPTRDAWDALDRGDDPTRT